MLNLLIALYAWAGFGFVWFVPHDSWKVKVLTFCLWPIAITWSVIVTFMEWWEGKGYHYDKT